MKSIRHIKTPMLFDVCIEGHDKVVDGLPSLPSNSVITTNKKGMQVIHGSINNMFPQRIWDICANSHSRNMVLWPILSIYWPPGGR